MLVAGLTTSDIGKACTRGNFTGELNLAYRNETAPVWMILKSDTEWVDLLPTDEVTIPCQRCGHPRSASVQALLDTAEALADEERWLEAHVATTMLAAEVGEDDPDVIRLRSLASLAEALDTNVWTPHQSATCPPEQGEYLCRTNGGVRVVLDWDGIAWDHPVRSQAGWEYWNEVVEYWTRLPGDPK